MRSFLTSALVTGGGAMKAQPEHRRGGRRGNGHRKPWLFGWRIMARSEMAAASPF